MKPGVLLTQENADRIGEVIRECLNSADLKACIKKNGRNPGNAPANPPRGRRRI